MSESTAEKRDMLAEHRAAKMDREDAMLKMNVAKVEFYRADMALRAIKEEIRKNMGHLTVPKRINTMPTNELVATMRRLGTFRNQDLFIALNGSRQYIAQIIQRYEMTGVLKRIAWGLYKYVADGANVDGAAAAEEKKF